MRGAIMPFLIFLWLLSLHQGKESDKHLTEINFLRAKKTNNIEYNIQF